VSSYTGHVPIGTTQCITCHTTTLSQTPAFSNFSSGKYPHTGTENCLSCHSNASVAATQAPNTLVHTTNAVSNCSTCHTNTASFSTWKIHTANATKNGSGVSYTACNSCHLNTPVPLVLKNVSSSASYSHFGINKANGLSVECSTCHQASMTTMTPYPSFTATNFKGGLFTPME